MFCTKCGSKLADGDKFCAKCGHPVRGTEGIATEAHETVADAKETVAEAAQDATEGIADVAEGVAAAAGNTTDGIAADLATDGDDADGFEDDDGTAPQPTAQPVAEPTATMPTEQMPYAQPVPQPQVPQYGYAQGQAPTGMGGQTGTQGQMPNQKLPWYMTMPGRIAMGAVGVILIVSGVVRMVGACTPADKVETPPIEKTEDPKPTTSPKPDDGGDDTSTGTGKPDDGQDVIVTDGGDVIVTDGNDIIIDDTGTSGTDDVDYGGGEKFDSWAEECTDTYDNPTVYAIAELKGWQLETLCQEMGLKWDATSKAWVGDGYKLQAFDTGRNALTDEEIALAGKLGTLSSVMYQIETSNYSGVSSALGPLCTSVMMCEDSDIGDQGVVVACGPSMDNVLVFAYERGSNVVIQVFSNPDVKEGMFDKFGDAKNVATGGTYGADINEVFEHFTGRKPGYR